MRCTNISCFLKCVLVCSTVLILQLFVYYPLRAATLYQSSLVALEHRNNQTSEFSFPKLVGNMSGSECHFEYNILVAISSSPENVLLRRAIRATFGSVLPIKFFLGQCGGTGEDSKRRCDVKNLKNEAERQRDLVIYDFLDAYNNLTLKTFSVLEFVTRCAPSVKLLIKIDDDTFVNPVRLRDILAENRVLPSKDSTERRKPLIFGHIQRGAKPYRHRSSKYYISQEEYSPNLFPPFVSGPLYFMNRLGVEALYRTALETSKRLKSSPLHLEDVFFTGFIANAANVSLVHVSGLDNAGLSKLPLPRYLTSRHFVRKPSKMFQCWRHLLHDVNSQLEVLRENFFRKDA